MLIIFRSALNFKTTADAVPVQSEVERVRSAGRVEKRRVDRSKVNKVKPSNLEGLVQDAVRRAADFERRVGLFSIPLPAGGAGSFSVSM